MADSWVLAFDAMRAALVNPDTPVQYAALYRALLECDAQAAADAMKELRRCEATTLSRKLDEHQQTQANHF